ncbi:reverse transcriptase domain-containing protein [Tanacetum coccineum]
MLVDIQETFDRLRAINMKLNPRKCSFGVKEGLFLGHLITKKGIKSNPSRVKAISNLKPPKTVEEIQSLKEKIARTRNRVQWTAEAEEAFQKIKEFIETLPTLTAPIKGEALIIYLAASIESISAVLLAERGINKTPIYFVSRTLQVAELDYPELEKLILALVYAARRLRRYFQAHLIRILTDKPIKQILATPKKSRRIAKGAIELGEHDMELKGRNFVKRIDTS